MTFRNFAGIGGSHGTAPDSLAWATDSRSLWSVRQRIVSPGGWALSGLIPISIGHDGTIRELPALHHPAGPLDGILWVGGDGLALAQFGTHGGYYRPPHDDICPDDRDGRRGARASARRLPRWRACRALPRGGGRTA